MTRSTVMILAACMLAAALWWLLPSASHGPLGALLLGLLAGALCWQQDALHQRSAELRSLRAEQGEGERRYRALFETSGDAVLLCELNDDGQPSALLEANEAACMALGYPQGHLLEMTFGQLLAPETRHATQRRLRTLDKVEGLACETACLTSGGQRLPVELSLRRLEADGERLCLVVACDISARTELAELARGACHRDELTGLLNRYGFVRAVWEARRRARRHGAQVLLLALKLTDLRATNARCGHSVGDALLEATGDVLRTSLRPGDALARLGGDEFVGLAVLGFDDEKRLDRAAVMTRFADALAAKRAELGGEGDLELRYGSLLVDWDALENIDELLGHVDQIVRPAGCGLSDTEHREVQASRCE